MRIAKLEVFRRSVGRQYATVIAHEGGEARPAVETSHFFFLKLTADNGRAGWGEISDLDAEYLPDMPGFQAELAAFLRGRDPFAVAPMHRDFRQHFDVATSPLAAAAECALDMAMYDLAARAINQPVYNLLGGALRQEVLVSWVAYIRDDLSALRDEVAQKRRQGFRAYKLKVGVDIELDEQRLAVLREEAGPEASLKLDANGGWTVDEAPRNIRRLAKYGLAGVETPVPRDNPRHIALVRKQVNVPILEHVGDVAYGMALVEARAVDVFNVATTACGGIWPARQVAALAQAAGLGVLLGSTVEQGPGTLAQLHLAAGIPNLALPSDLIGPGMYTSDVLRQPLAYRQGALDIPAGPGLGAEIDEQALRAEASSP